MSRHTAYFSQEERLLLSRVGSGDGLVVIKPHLNRQVQRLGAIGALHSENLPGQGVRLTLTVYGRKLLHVLRL